MASDNVFKVIIEAIDHLSAPFEKINAKVLAAQVPIREIGERLEHLGEVSGIEAIGEKFAHVRERIGEAAEKLGEFMGPMAALAGIGSLAGLVEIAAHTGEMAEQLEKASRKIGIGAEDLEKLQFAAKEAEVPVDAMEMALSKLNKVVAEAAAGKNRDAASMFSHLGISLRDSQHHLLSAAEVLPKLADALQRNEAPALRTRIAMTAMGRGGAEMLPMLIGGSEALAAWAEQAEKVGMLNEQQLGAAGQLGLAFKNLRLTVEGIADAIGAALAPALTPIIKHFTDWLQLHREIIATKIEHVVIRLGDALDRVDWPKFLRGVEDAVTSVGHFMRDTLGLKGTIILLTAVLGAPLLRAIAGVATAMAGLLPALAANPIIAAIGLIGFAGFELYEHWDQIAKWWHHMWKGMADDADQAHKKIAPPTVTDRVEKHQSGRYANLKSGSDTAGEHGYNWYESHAGHNTNAQWQRGRKSTFEDLGAMITAATDRMQTSLNAMRLEALPIMDFSPALVDGISGIGGVPVRDKPTRSGRRLTDDGRPERRPIDDESSRLGEAAGRLIVTDNALAQAIQNLNQELSRGSLGTIDVNFNGPPPGTRIITKSSGPVVPKTHVGWNMRDGDDR